MCGEGFLCFCITVWHGRKKVFADDRSNTTTINSSRCRKSVFCILKDLTHPAHTLFVSLPSGRKPWSINSRTPRLRKTFFPEAVRLLTSGGALCCYKLKMTGMRNHLSLHTSHCTFFETCKLSHCHFIIDS